MRMTLREKDPGLAAEWSEKNLPLTPDDVSFGSNRRVWWKGKCGHEWDAIIKNRVNGASCPICSHNRVFKGINDLKTTRPEIAAQWSDRNKDVSPDKVSAYSNRRVWWCCEKGHEWLARVADRTQGHGCPYCCGNTFKEGVNDLETLQPEIAAEWSDKNGLLKPSMESPKSRDVVWWKADCGHEWQDSISNRTMKKRGCPNCERKFRTDLPRLLVTFYAKRYGMKAVFDSCRETGLSLDVYIPDANLAINFHRVRNGPRWRSEDIRSYACALKGISFFIIANWKTDRELAEQVKEAFRRCNIHITSDADVDLVMIRDQYMKWLKSQG